MSQTLAPSSSSFLAEAALRNLHVELQLPENKTETFGTRMLHLDGTNLIVDLPTSKGKPVKIPSGRTVTCSCRLGREIYRFEALVQGRDWFELNESARVPVLVLSNPTTPTVVQRRRYYRLSLAGRDTGPVKCWLVANDAETGRVEVRKEFTSQIVDISGGGMCILVESGELPKDLKGVQLWVRFMLPGENESLIFRAEPRHFRKVDKSGLHRVGVEFMEYIEPGQHRQVVDHLAKFIAETQREHLRRR